MHSFELLVGRYNSKLNIQNSIPPCPDCGAHMMAGYGDPAGINNLVWACRACGATFVYDEEYRLRPYFLEINYPACPECGSDMIASSTPQGRPDTSTTWTCKACGETINF